MTDREIMLHRFKNIKRSTGELAKWVGIPRSEYEAACKRAIDAEAKELWGRQKQNTCDETEWDI